MRLVLAMTALAFALGCGRGTRPEAVGQGQVFSAPGGETVTLVPLLPTGSGKYLLYFQGTKDEMDGKVLPHQAPVPELVSFYSRWRGREVRFFHAERKRNSERYILVVPNRENVVSVFPDEARTQALKAGDIYALYQRQLEDGTISRAQQPDRKYWMGLEHQDLAPPIREMNEACGAQVEVRIVWDSVSDAQLFEDDVSAYCLPPLYALRELCGRSEEARRTVRNRVKAMDCQIGKTLDPRVEAEKVVWTTPVGMASASQDQATDFFLDNL